MWEKVLVPNQSGTLPGTVSTLRVDWIYIHYLHVNSAAVHPYRPWCNTTGDSTLKPDMSQDTITGPHGPAYHAFQAGTPPWHMPSSSHATLQTMHAPPLVWRWPFTVAGKDLELIPKQFRWQFLGFHMLRCCGAQHWNDLNTDTHMYTLGTWGFISAQPIVLLGRATWHPFSRHSHLYFGLVLVFYDHSTL